MSLVVLESWVPWSIIQQLIVMSSHMQITTCISEHAWHVQVRTWSCVIQVEGSNLDNDDAAHNGPMVSDSSSDHGSAAQQRSASKRSGERASESRHSSRDSSLARTTKIVKPVVQTKAVEGRKRLRKPS